MSRFTCVVLQGQGLFFTPQLIDLRDLRVFLHYQEIKIWYKQAVASSSVIIHMLELHGVAKMLAPC